MMEDNNEKWEIIRQNPEEQVIEILENRANAEGWKTIDKNVGRVQGVDLKLLKANNVIVIEAKGEREGPPQHRSELNGVLGEIIMDMKEEKLHQVYSYCIAFPKTDRFRRTVDNIPLKPRQRLGLNIIFVDCSTRLLTVLQSAAQHEIALNNFDELCGS